MKVWHLIAISAVTGAIVMHTVDASKINKLQKDNDFLIDAYCEIENKYLAKLDPDSYEYRYQVGEIDENGNTFDNYEGLENE